MCLYISSEDPQVMEITNGGCFNSLGFEVCFLFVSVCLFSTGNRDTPFLVIVCHGCSHREMWQFLGKSYMNSIVESTILVRALGNGSEKKAWL